MILNFLLPLANSFLLCNKVFMSLLLESLAELPKMSLQCLLQLQILMLEFGNFFGKIMLPMEELLAVVFNPFMEKTKAIPGHVNFLVDILHIEVLLVHVHLKLITKNVPGLSHMNLDHHASYEKYR